MEHQHEHQRADEHQGHRRNNHDREPESGTQHEHQRDDERERGHRQEQPSHYRGLLTMAILSFSAMYVLMYAMVDRLANVYLNLNQAYMAGLMAAPMVLIELVVMRAMYRNTKVNLAIAAASTLVFVVCFGAIRSQTAISDSEFLRSMIPHHAGAILMCEEAPVRDAEIAKLCEGIRAGQQAEIEQMKAKLSALK
jgi:cation transport ATPase